LFERESIIYDRRRKLITAKSKTFTSHVHIAYLPSSNQSLIFRTQIAPPALSTSFAHRSTFITSHLLYDLEDVTLVFAMRHSIWCHWKMSFHRDRILCCTLLVDPVCLRIYASRPRPKLSKLLDIIGPLTSSMSVCGLTSPEVLMFVVVVLMECGR
jgi:hypothetical protein